MRGCMKWQLFIAVRAERAEDAAVRQLHQMYMTTAYRLATHRTGMNIPCVQRGMAESAGRMCTRNTHDSLLTGNCRGDVDDVKMNIARTIRTSGRDRFITSGEHLWSGLPDVINRSLPDVRIVINVYFPTQIVARCPVCVKIIEQESSIYKISIDIDSTTLYTKVAKEQVRRKQSKPELVRDLSHSILSMAYTEEEPNE